MFKLYALQTVLLGFTWWRSKLFMWWPLLWFVRYTSLQTMGCNGLCGPLFGKLGSLKTDDIRAWLMPWCGPPDDWFRSSKSRHDVLLVAKSTCSSNNWLKQSFCCETLSQKQQQLAACVHTVAGFGYWGSYKRQT